MKSLVLLLVLILFFGCDVRVEDKQPDVNVVKPPDVKVETPKVDVEIDRDK